MNFREYMSLPGNPVVKKIVVEKGKAQEVTFQRKGEDAVTFELLGHSAMPKGEWQE